MDNDSNFEEILNEPFHFPEGILNQISESSPEGFLLFVIDENGDVEMFKRDSADIIEAGLRARALKILNALNSIDDGEVTNSIISQRHPNDDDSDEDSSL